MLNTNINSLPYLSEQEATDLLKKNGYNELPSTKSRNVFKIAFEIISDPMFSLLTIGGTLYLILGSLQEALILFGFVLFVMGMTFYQEHKTERALETLRNLSSPRALVIRDGVEKRIAGREVVCGDLLIIREGDCIPADAILLSSNNLTIDESILTGESIPVRKLAAETINKTYDQGYVQRPGGDDTPYIYSGSLAVQGYGIAKVQTVGLQTEMGKIGKSLHAIKPEKTQLQKETAHLVKKIAILGLLLCVLLIIVFGLTRGNWLHGFLAGITMGMSILPEELPVILMIFLAIGAWRMAKNQVLKRHVPVVETLGSATVLCVDKTGTLTTNQMTVTELYVDEEFFKFNVPKCERYIPENFHALLEYSILASQSDPFDPMEKAIHQIGNQYLAQTEHIHKDWTLVREYPLSKSLLAISHVWQSPDSINYEIAAKGSPEAIADLCHFDNLQLQNLSKKIKIMASKGLRVLGVAKACFQKSNLPSIQHDFPFHFIGLIGLSDPVRPTVFDAMKQCYSAGIRVIMLTGDYPVTAQNIAQQIGLNINDGIIIGNELERMSDRELQERIKITNIFARIMPEQKLRLVNALKANGEIVAMTGDGVNDAPALKSSHIGIAMGKRGTDVARESASLVLIDDDFSSIVKAIRLGRKIFDNIKKAFAYTLAVHIPIAGLSCIPVFLKMPLMFFPIHIVFLEMIINPSCSIIFEAEAEEQDIMQRPPRNPKEKLFSRNMVALGLIQGFSVLLIALTMFVGAQYFGYNEAHARTLTFALLVLTNLGLILTNRSLTHSIFTLKHWQNKALWWIISSALILLSVILYVPFLRQVFYFGALNIKELAVCLGIGLCSIVWLEVVKMLFNYLIYAPVAAQPTRSP